VYEGPVAKKSTTNQRKEHYTTLSLAIFIRSGVVVASQICEIIRKFELTSYSSSRSSKVIIDLGVNRKRICDFLLVINCNFGRISYRFRDRY